MSGSPRGYRALIGTRRGGQVGVPRGGTMWQGRG